MMNTIETMSLEAKIGQLLMASLNGPVLDDEAKAFLSENHIGNLIHFGNNVETREQATAFNAELSAYIEKSAGIPPLFGIDHEGGRVMRFRSGVTGFPSAMAVGATQNTGYARQIGRAMGEELRAMGFHINFAPALDINTNPRNPVIGVRSYGDRPERVAAFGTAVVEGMQSAGLMACGKHFPGHGDTAQDSHYALPSIDRPLASLLETELVPFQAAIDHGLEAIMTSHILFPQVEPNGVPATMSPAILQDLLRKRMGFDGLIITDGMHMQAIAEHYGIERGCIEAVRAGVDLLCVGTGGSGRLDSQASCYRALVAAAKSGELPMERIDASVKRILAAKTRHCTPYHGPVDFEADARLAADIADASITLLRGTLPALSGSIACVSVPTDYLRFGVGEGDWRTHSFSGSAATLLGGEAVALTEETGFAPLDAADTVIIGVGEGTPLELSYVQEALRRGKNTIAVLTRTPYPLPLLPGDCPVLCMYWLTPVSVQAVCRVLRGEVSPGGVSPVLVK